MRVLFRIGVALAMTASIAGCATPRPSVAPAAVVTPLRTKVIPAVRADAIAVGKSTRSEVAAVLGETLIIRFESGFELWLYRIASDAPAKAAAAQSARNRRENETESATGEFVVLFAPSGIVTKTRIRPPSNRDARLPGLEPDPENL